MKKVISFLTVILLLVVSCKTDFVNPNAPTVESINSSPQGLINLVTGSQWRYSVGATSALYTSITAAGLSAGELRVLNAGNADLANLKAGGSSLTPDNPIVTNLWTSLNLVRQNGEFLFDNAGKFPIAADANTIRVYGNFYRALSIGTMAQFWENVVIKTAQNADFVTRTQGLEESVRLLQEASALLSTDVPSTTITALVGANINIRNSVFALLARYNLFLGKNQEAITAAQTVLITSKSFFDYNTVSQNPVFRVSLTTNNLYDVVTNFGLPSSLLPSPADGRIAFYLTAMAANGKGFFKSDTDGIPIYLPGEMLLIQAEANARLSKLPEAKAALDLVLTKTTDVFSVNANLPASGPVSTQNAMLDEIYKNRCIELFMSGMKLEDNRRFDASNARGERNRNFYPYPSVERFNNTKTPPNPAN
jgi:starch-binding outer membrane protein, SusD/RagB family